MDRYPNCALGSGLPLKNLVLGRRIQNNAGRRRGDGGPERQKPG
jgi:hypothetical protein